MIPTAAGVDRKFQSLPMYGACLYGGVTTILPYLAATSEDLHRRLSLHTTTSGNRVHTS